MTSRDAITTAAKGGPSLAVLVAMAALGPIALNIFVPSMPGLQATMGVDYSVAQLTLSLYLAALAFAQLIVGPLSDRYGRRPVFIAGTVLFIFASLGCAAAVSIEQLILGRILQAIGGCAGITISRAVIRDRYERDEAASKMGYVTMAMIVGPMLAPALGGYLDELGGWRISFYLVSAIGVGVLALVWMRLEETHRGDPGDAGFTRLFRISAALIREPVFMGFSLGVAFSTAIFFAFVAGAPFIVTKILGGTPSDYGNNFITVSAGYMLGNFLAGRLSVRFSAAGLIFAGMGLLAVGLAALSIFTSIGVVQIWLLFAPMVLVAVSNGLIIPAGTASAISVRPDIAGSGAGIAGFLQIGVSALATGAVSLFHDGTMAPTLTIMLVCGVISLLLMGGAEFAHHKTGGA